MLLKGKKQPLFELIVGILFTMVKSSVGAFWISRQNTLGLPWLRKLVDYNDWEHVLGSELTTHRDISDMLFLLHQTLEAWEYTICSLIPSSPFMCKFLPCFPSLSKQMEVFGCIWMEQIKIHNGYLYNHVRQGKPLPPVQGELHGSVRFWTHDSVRQHPPNYNPLRFVLFLTWFGWNGMELQWLAWVWNRGEEFPTNI